MAGIMVTASGRLPRANTDRLPRARWEVRHTPAGWVVHLRAGNQHIGYFFPRAGGVRALSEGGALGHKIDDTIKVPATKVAFLPFVKVFLADMVTVIRQDARAAARGRR